MRGIYHIACQKGLLLGLIFLTACSGLEKSEKEKIRRANEVSEPIYRLSHESLTIEGVSAPKKRDSYPWESRYVGQFPEITKEFFRCRGDTHHPRFIAKNARGVETTLIDCGGIDDHSLPLRDGEEYISSSLIHLLNYVQRELAAKVVVTCGHRCPKHNSYVDKEGKERASKHMIGAEVDFYVEGYQHRPLEVIKALMQYYRDQDETKDYAYLTQFSRAKKARSKVFDSWMNRELIIHLLAKEEGRDLDNNHPYPYICLELRSERFSGKAIHFNVIDAHSGLLRDVR